MSKAHKSAELKLAAKGKPGDNEAAKPRVRDRIFDTACELFYRQGIRSVGVDTIASEAGTNKMSFYRNFASKDDLISEYLQKEADDFFKWWDETIAPYEGNPRRQIEALIAGQIQRILNQECHGCTFMNAAVELRDSDHPALKIIQDNKAESLRRLRKLARDAGARTPDQLADALALIAAGNLMTRISYAHDQWPGAQSLKIVKQLLQAYID
jgi:AcrR family transcriptional regulator